MPTSVLFLVPYPLKKAPSQRFRVELFFPVLVDRKINFRVEGFLSSSAWQILYKNGSSLKKTLGVLSGFLRRLAIVLFVVPKYDFIFIHREASPIGPPVFEWIIAKLWKKKIIYDFDDAIWMPDSAKTSKVYNWLKAFWKVKCICKWSYKVVGGNEYLRSYAANYNERAILIPTCVDTVNIHNQLKDQHKKSKIVIGWTGSHSTMTYLNNVLPVLQQISDEFTDVEFVVISNQNPQLPLRNCYFVPWNEMTEVSDLLKLDIGIMPLTNDDWSEGKCGFKLIQYMALGIPPVASPVGVNKKIISHSVDGFLCETHEEWYQSLVTLIKSEQLRTKMGVTGRKKIEDHYSVQANASLFSELFK